MRKVFVLLGLLAGCSSSSPKKPVTAAFPVTVLDAYTRAPLAAVAVALDDAAGTRQEAQSDATGVATFQVDWTKAPVSLTLYAEGYTAASYLGIAKADKYQTSLAGNIAPMGTQASGQISNKDMAGDEVTLSASVHAGYFQGISAAYTIEIYDDKPYSLYALDWVAGGGQKPSKRGTAQTFKKWVQVDAPAPSPAASVDVDFSAATALAAVHTSGAITIPGGATGALAQSTAYVTVSDSDSLFSSFVGAPLFLDVSADGSQFQYSLEHVQPAAIAKPVTTYSVSSKSGAATAKNDPAWPADGATIADLLDPPLVTTPVPGGSLAFGQAPAFTPPSGDASLFLEIMLAGGTAQQQLLWYVYAPAGTALVPPALPSSVDAEVALPPGTLSGQIVACSPPDSEICTLYATSDRFNISR